MAAQSGAFTGGVAGPALDRAHYSRSCCRCCRRSFGTSAEGGALARAMSTQCHLLNGLFAEGVQVALGVVAIASLAAKRLCEKPRRPWRVWLLDVAKQAAGGLFAHCLNLIAAEFLSASSAFHDQCAWYFMNFTLDTSVGVLVAWALLKGVERWAKRANCVALARSGDYDSSIVAVDYGRWALQLLSWLGITLIVKAILVSVIYGAHTVFVEIGDKISAPFVNSRHLELVVVMIVCPCAMNILQFWIQDTFLKHNKGARLKKHRNSDEAEHLLRASDVDPPATDSGGGYDAMQARDSLGRLLPATSSLRHTGLGRGPLAVDSSSEDGW